MQDKIIARGVRRSFGAGAAAVHALGPAELTVGDGEFVCVVGPSGCGKSTLLRVLAGLVRPTQGEVVIHQRDADRQLLSVVFQEYSIYQWKTVEENVRLGLDIAGVPRAEASARVEDWLERMHLIRVRTAYPHTLSGGMKQRVAIARALVVGPEIILMDEPFAALDAQLRMVLQEELLALWQQDRRTVVFVTHSLDEAILLGDRVVVMSASPGTVVAEFEVPFTRPRSTELRARREFGELENEIWTLLRQEISGPAPVGG